MDDSDEAECFLRRNHLLKGIRSRVPMIKQMLPAGRNEKNESLSNPALVSVSSTTRLGGVPINVIMPPMLLAKAIGIKKRDVPIPELLAILATIGNIKATVPVLLTKAPIIDVTPTTSKKSFISLLPDRDRRRAPIIFASPVWKIAPPTTNSPIIIITIELENPDKDSSVVSIPETESVVSAINATTSERILPQAKKEAANKRVRIVISIVN